MTYPDPYQQDPQQHQQYPQYPSDPQYPQYPSDPQYPQYPSDPQNQQYPQYPQYQQQPVYYPAAPYPAAGQGTNTMALLSLIFSLLGLITGITAPVGVVMGHIARKQLRTSGEGGAGMATAGLIVGYVLTGLYLVACCGWFAFVFYAASHNNTTY